ncbi:hypothetical protein EI94DRAFT_1741081 [Lactarius quietus]|nr:hypothetical protein EI94DRAFT_1741081 [Lactarius quietus]
MSWTSRLTASYALSKLCVALTTFGHARLLYILVSESREAVVHTEDDLEDDTWVQRAKARTGSLLGVFAPASLAARGVLRSAPPRRFQYTAMNVAAY